MIQINDHIIIPERELQFKAIRASGPGGQNVNRVKTAVQLRFDAASSPSLPPEVLARLLKLAGKMVSHRGELIIEAGRYRTQERNRADAVERLVRLLQRAAKKPKKRKKTRPGKAARERRLQSKHQQAEKKRRRNRPQLA